MKNTSILLFILTAVLQSCAVKQQQKSICLSGSWILESIDSKPLNTMENPPKLELHPAENKVFGFGGCNRISGSMQTSGDTVKFGPLIATKMACPALETETSFLRVISDNEMKFSITGGKLNLNSDKGSLAFKKAD